MASSLINPKMTAVTNGDRSVPRLGAGRSSHDRPAECFPGAYKKCFRDQVNYGRRFYDENGRCGNRKSRLIDDDGAHGVPFQLVAAV